MEGSDCQRQRSKKSHSAVLSLVCTSLRQVPFDPWTCAICLVVDLVCVPESQIPDSKTPSATRSVTAISSLAALVMEVLRQTVLP